MGNEDMRELKPCPVCKRKPNLEYSDDHDPFNYKRYYRFACCGIIGEAHENLLNAVEAWERKAYDG